MPDSDVLRCKIAQAVGLRTILFVCTGNSIRSQMAEALVNNFLGQRWVAFSAGIIPTELNPNVLKVMKEIGIDMKGQRAKHIDIFHNCSFTKVITLCSDADRMCLTYPVSGEQDRIIFHDPISSYGLGFGSITLFRTLRDEIKQKLLAYLKGE